MLTQQRLQEVLDYDRNTGEFIVKQKRPNSPIGSIAGKITIHGYRSIGIDGKNYYAHRLAWLWTYGQLPSLNIDHKNGNGLDNRIDNLREVTQQQNTQNVRKRSNNTSGIAGVHWHKQYKKWQARISINHKKIHLGYYDDIWDAICTRKSAELVYQPLRVVSNQ